MFISISYISFWKTYYNIIFCLCSLDSSQALEKWIIVDHYPFPKQQILDSSKLKEFADHKFKFDDNYRKFSKWVENNGGKGEIAL